MTPKQFIENAIDQGSRESLQTLNELQKLVFLISEAEVCCDMEGIDSFLDQYDMDEILLTYEAFRSVGALEIAEGLKKLSVLLPTRDEDQLSYINQLITDRVGYDYEAIESTIVARMA